MEVVRHQLADDILILQGHVIDGLRTIPGKSVQCVVTSDPYWGLRDYGQDQTVEWPEVTYTPMPGAAPITVPAWTGPYGLEPTPEMYVAHSVLIRRELWRAMRDDATHLLNLGDSYNGSGGAGGDYGPGGIKEGQPKYPGRRVGSLKPKDLCGIPWRVAFALQADGWYLRSDIIWSKPNPMPESVTDRPTKAHEYVFLLTKSPTYYYDADAIAEVAVGQNEHDLTGGGYAPPGQTEHTGSRVPKSATFKRDNSKRAQVIPGQTVGTHRPDREDTVPNGRRNKRSVWTISTKPFPEAHFATFPEELPELCILAGSSPQACPKCGAPWKRVVELIPADSPPSYNGSSFTSGKTAALKPNVGQKQRYIRVPTDRFEPDCSCEENDGSGKCIVLDPFNGSGTAGKVALQHGRAYIGCELNPDYVEMTRRRIHGGQIQFAL